MQPSTWAALVIAPAVALTLTRCGGQPRTDASTPAPGPSHPVPHPADAPPPVTSASSTEPPISGTGDAPVSAALPPTANPIPSPQPDTNPIPKVTLTNIGLHVGGGPNDAATKAPFERAIQKQFDDFKRCYGKITSPGTRGTYGIDLLVDKEGGHPTPSGSRTAMPGDAFRDCMAQVFETVVFDKPKHGTTKISYALRFEPGS